VQDAINPATSGDILKVITGIYSEDILVDKKINIFDSSFALQGNAVVSGTGSLYLDDTSMILNTLTVQSGGLFRYYNSGTTLYVGEQNIYGTAEWWEARIVSGNIFVHDGGMLYVNSTDVNMNCSFDGEYGIQVNATGTMVTADNGTGRSEITADDTNYYYFFNVYGSLSASDTDIRYGWELYINNASTVSLGNNVLVQHMDNHGIHVSGSPDVWIANSNVNFNTQYGMAVELGSSVWVASTTISNNNMGIVVSDSTLSVAGCDIQTNSMIGLLGDSSTIALSGNIITTNAAWDVYAIGCIATSEDDDITNMMQVYCDFTVFPGLGLQTISGWWVFHNATAGNDITVQTDVEVEVGGGLFLGNTTFIMDSTSAGWTVALDVYGRFRAQLWDGSPNRIQGANKAPFYLRAQAGSTFNLTDCYLNNVGIESNNLDETGPWVNTNNFIIQDNIIANNYNGLVFQDITGPATVVSGNTISNCGGIAIVVYASDTMYIESNMISQSMAGTSISGSTNIDLQLNIITDCDIVGIHYDDSQGDVANNTVTKNGLGYYWEYTGITWMDITPGGTPLSLADDDFAVVPVGFNFNYYNKPYNSINIMSNGWMSFVDSESLPNATTVPQAGDGLEGVIAPFGRDLDPTQGGEVYYQTIGSAPNRIFIVEYFQIQNWPGGGNAKTFEVLFYEGLDIIVFQYLVAPDDPEGIGIERPDEATGIGNGSGWGNYIDPTSVAPGIAIRFSPYTTMGFGGGIFVENNSAVDLYNNIINNNGYWGIANDNSDVKWYIDSFAEAKNNDILLFDDVYVLSGGTLHLENLDAQLHNVDVDGKANIDNCPSSIISYNVWIDGNVWLNSSSWEINSSFDGEFLIQVNSSGRLTMGDNGTGRSEITAYNSSNYYLFIVFGILDASNSDITYGWELYINNPANTITIGGNVNVQYMANNGIHVSASPFMVIGSSWVTDNNNGMLVDSGSTVTATGTYFNNNWGGAGVVLMGSSSFTATNCYFNGNNNEGIAVIGSTVSLTGSEIQSNGLLGLYGDSSSITLDGNTIVGNSGWDIYCENSILSSTNDVIGNMILYNCNFTVNPGLGLTTISDDWIFVNCTGANSIIFQTDVMIQAGGGDLVLRNTTLIMDSASAGWTLALDIYGSFSARLWDGNMNRVQGAGGNPYYFRAWGGSSFTLIDTYVENAGISSLSLDETGLYVNTLDYFIQNNTLQNNHNALVFHNVFAPSNIILGNVIMSNTATGIYLESSTVPIIGNFIDNNGEYGIYWHDSFVTPSVQWNVVSNNVLGGVFLDADMDLSLGPGDMLWNTISGNSVFGLRMAAQRDIDGQFMAADGNVIDANIGDGVVMDAGRNMDVAIAADVTNNGGDGYDISANNVLTATIYNSLIDNNQGYGISMATNNLGITAYIYDNVILNNGQDAVYINAGGSGTYVEITGNLITGNGVTGTPGVSLLDVWGLVDGNTVSGGGGDGLYVENSDVDVTNNFIESNAGNGISLYASDILISDNNLNWNTGDGVNVVNSNPTISNNHIEGNANGMQFQASSGTVSGNTLLSNNVDGITLLDSSPTIINNLILSNLANGIYAGPSAPKIIGNTIGGNGGNGIFLADSAGQIMDNAIINNSMNGIYLVSSNPLIRNNTILGNNVINYAGIYVNQFSSPVIDSNTMSGNYHGIYVDDYSAPLITGNSINSNDYNGIYVANDSSPTISSNNINSNGQDGIYVRLYSNAEILGNTLNANFDSGIYIDGSTARIAGNTVTGNGLYGIFVYASDDDPSVTIDDNTLSGNYDDNIYILAFNFDTTVTISNNIIENSNIGYGIRAVGPNLLTITVDSNIISGNNIDAIFMSNTGASIIVTITDNDIFNSNGYGILITCDFTIFATIQDNEIVQPYYSGIYLTAVTGQNVYADILGNTVRDSVQGTGLHIVAQNYVSADITDNIIVSNYNDNILIDVRSGQGSMQDITIANNELSGSSFGSGIDILALGDVIILVEGNDLSGNFDHNLKIVSGSAITGGFIDASISGNEIGSGSVAGRGIHLWAYSDIYAVIQNNDLQGNYQENIYGYSAVGSGYFTIQDNTITSSVTREGIYLEIYDDLTATVNNNFLSNNYRSNVWMQALNGDMSAAVIGNSLNNSNIGYGLYMYAYNMIYNTIISSNHISGNFIRGLSLEADTSHLLRVEITYNTITLNNDFGIYGIAEINIESLEIAHNLVADNRFSGIFLDCNGYADTTAINNNIVTRNGFSGPTGVHLDFRLGTRSGFEFSQNTVTNNNGRGVLLAFDGGDILGSAVFSDNYIAGNGGDGLVLFTTFSCNILQVVDNTIENNDGNGIFIDFGNGFGTTSALQITGNTVTNSDDWGIIVLAQDVVNTAQVNQNTITDSFFDGIFLSFANDLDTLQLNDNTVVNSFAPDFAGISVSVGNRLFSGEALRNSVTNVVGGENGYGIYVDVVNGVGQWSENHNTVSQTFDSSLYFRAGLADSLQFNYNSLSSSGDSGIYVEIFGWTNTAQYNENSITNTLGSGMYIYMFGATVMDISDNTLTTISDHGIELYQYADVDVFSLTGNTVDNAVDGVSLYFSDDIVTAQIHANTITNAGSGYGLIFDCDLTTGSLDFTNNNIDNSQDGVAFAFNYAPQSSTITDNIISGVVAGYGFAYNSINTSGTVSALEFAGNEISNTDDGVFIEVYCIVDILSIDSNVIANTANNHALNIDLFAATGIFELTNNIIDNSNNGIELYFTSGAETVTIEGNSVTNINSDFGLYLWSGSQNILSLECTDNDIDNTRNGVYMHLSGVVWNLDISGNTITDVAQDYGLFFDAISTVDTAVIENNYMENIYFEAMHMLFADGPTILNFNYNTVTSAGSDGVYITSGTNIDAFTMAFNSVTAAGGYGMYVETTFDLTIDMNTNVFSNNFDSNLYLSSLSGNLYATLSSSTISNSIDDKGIEIMANGDLSADLTGNDISGNYNDNIFAFTPSGSGFFTLTNNVISDSTYGYGAYLEMDFQGVGELFVTATDCEISNNFLSNLAMVSTGYSYLTLMKCDLSGSMIENGLDVDSQLDMTAELDSNTISSNYNRNINLDTSNAHLTITDNDISNSLWDSGMYITVTQDITASILRNIFFSNHLRIFIQCGNADLDIKDNEITNTVTDFGLHVFASTNLNAVIGYNNISNNRLVGMDLSCISSINVYIHDNNIMNNGDDGMEISASSTLEGVIKNNEIHGNRLGITLGAGSPGGEIQVYDNSISNSLVRAIFAYGDISGSFHDNRFRNNDIAIVMDVSLEPVISENIFSYNNYDIQLVDSNTTISYNHFEFTYEVCIQTLDSWPTIAWNTFENIGWEIRNPPAEPQKVMQIEFTSDATQSWPPAILAFNTVDISMAESLYALNANIQVHACMFDDTPYNNIVAINSDLWIDDSTLVGGIELENDNTIVKLMDSIFIQEDVTFVDSGALLDVGYTTDVLVVDQFGIPQVNLEVNVSDAQGGYNAGYTNSMGYLNGSETTAYREDGTGRYYSMNPHTITVGNGISILATDTFYVGARSLRTIVLNNAPTWLGLAVTFPEDTQFSFDLDDYADDDGGDANLMYSFVGGGNIAVIMDSNNVVTFIPDQNWWGSEGVTFRAMDGFGLYTDYLLIVNVTSVEDMPLLAVNLPDKSFEEDGSVTNAFDLDGHFTDVDSTLSYTESATTFIMVTIDPAENTVSFSSTSDWSGSEDITFTANDGTYSISDTMRVTVTPENDAPYITTSPVIIATEDALYTYDVDATDVDESFGDVLSYYLTSNPAGMIMDSTTGVVSWTPTFSQAETGSFDVTVMVTDSEGANDVQSFTIIAVVANYPPSITGIALAPTEIKEGDTITATPAGWSDDQTGAALAQYEFQWYRNSEIILGATTSTLSADYFEKGDVITVDVTPYDGDKYGATLTSQAVVVQNSPPSISGVIFSPQAPTEIDDITAIPVGSLDPDESDSIIIYYYSWQVNYQTVPGLIGDTLEAGEYDEGDVITVTVTPSDGEDNGNPIKSEEIVLAGDPTDTDMDGIPDIDDAFPHDFDNDATPDINDAFPFNGNESSDIDSDGIGDNTDSDKDGDGVRNEDDRFPFDANEWDDFDRDGMGDNADVDDDGDEVPDVEDAFQYDETESQDMDGDGIGDNQDSDTDGDGVPNNRDDFSTNSLEWNDHDGDGIGDNADPDDDNDKVVDWEDYAPLDKNSNLEPFWWWWILIVVLIIILIMLVLITRRPPDYEMLPDEEAIIAKEQRSTPPRRKTEAEEEVEETLLPEEDMEEFEEMEEPEELGEMLEDAESELKELGFVNGERKMYSDVELKAMDKSDLKDYASELGLSTEGTRFAILSRVKAYQKKEKDAGVQGAEEEGEDEQSVEAEDTEELECPSCGKVFSAEISKRPADVECPHCGAKGTID
jgi:parallel beta-helix repeat protein